MILIVVAILLLVLYFYTTRNHNYWAKRNIKYDRPLPIFGNHLTKALGLKSITTVASELYYKYPEEKVVGYFSGVTPELIIRDPDIIRDILNVNFGVFYMRGLGRDVNKEPLLKNIFNADGDSWRLIRQRLTPAFTLAKLKNMFPLIIKCTDKLNGLGEDIVAKGGECDVRELMARFTTDFIGACGLGIEMDTINNENSIFRDIGKEIFSRSNKEVLLHALWELFPELRSILNLFDPNLEKIFIKMITKVFAQRNFQPSGRNDFIDLLLELSSKGKIVGESIEERQQDGLPKIVEMEMDLMCMIAQVFVFFGAGFETSSSSTSYTLHELAFHPDIQEKIQIEIDQVLAKYDNKLCYDAVSEFTLLDMAFKESLRIFPALGTLHRVCTRKFTIPQIDVTIDPGVKIIIPVEAIQNDPKYFKDPDKFIPERFTSDEEKSRHKYVYLPFGDGPRACIGT